MVKTLLILLFLFVAAIALVFAFLFLRKAQQADAARAELEPLRRYIKVRDAEEAAKIMYAKARDLIREREQESNRAIEAAKVIQLAALEDAKRLQVAARAMRNIIEGYGDRYLEPHEAVLDELAEEWSHKETGQELKAARKRTKQLLRDGRAAECDYKEDQRRENAIKFVIDAFDGKVSDILSKTKHDNYGTLKQKIRDSYALVNHHGAAFRNARITDQYAASRMDELQWAVATKELQRKSREEQREIREKMREEERVRRELEKAQQEAEKEARTVEEALRKAQEQFSNSSQEERSAFQTKIDELEAELKEAQRKGERAISMAQQTRRGHVYIISNVGSFGDGIYKIGMTRRLEPQDRVKELGDASVPFPFDVHAMIESTDAPLLESALHDEFSLHRVNRVNKRKEFFHAPLADIRRLVEAREIDAHWTMLADAAEYRETLVLQARERGEEIQADTIHKNESATAAISLDDLA